MVLSHPYLTLVAIGLSGIPSTGSPAPSRNQEVSTVRAVHAQQAAESLHCTVGT